jgi:hypothetical protein
VFNVSPALTTPKITTGIQNASAATVISMDSSTFFAGAFSDEVTALGNTGTAVTIDCDDGNVFTATLTGNCTFTLASANSTSNRATSFTLVLTNDATASRTVAFAGGTFNIRAVLLVVLQTLTLRTFGSFSRQITAQTGMSHTYEKLIILI